MTSLLALSWVLPPLLGGIGIVSISDWAFPPCCTSGERQRIQRSLSVVGGGLLAAMVLDYLVIATASALISNSDYGPLIGARMLGVWIVGLGLGARTLAPRTADEIEQASKVALTNLELRADRLGTTADTSLSSGRAWLRIAIWILLPVALWLLADRLYAWMRPAGGDPVKLIGWAGIVLLIVAAVNVVAAIGASMARGFGDGSRIDTVLATGTSIGFAFVELLLLATVVPYIWNRGAFGAAVGAITLALSVIAIGAWSLPTRALTKR